MQTKKPTKQKSVGIVGENHLDHFLAKRRKSTCTPPSWRYYEEEDNADSIKVFRCLRNSCSFIL